MKRRASAVLFEVWLNFLPCMTFFTTALKLDTRHFSMGFLGPDFASFLIGTWLCGIARGDCLFTSEAQLDGRLYIKQRDILLFQAGE